MGIYDLPKFGNPEKIKKFQIIIGTFGLFLYFSCFRQFIVNQDCVKSVRLGQSLQ